MKRRKPSRNWDFVRKTFRQYNLAKSIILPTSPEQIIEDIDKSTEKTTSKSTEGESCSTSADAHEQNDRSSSPLTDADGLCKSGRMMKTLDSSQSEMNSNIINNKSPLLEEDSNRRRHRYLQNALMEEAFICKNFGMDRSGMCIRHPNQIIFDIPQQSIGMTEYQNHHVNTCRICRSESKGGGDGNVRRHQPAMINVINEVQKMQSNRKEWKKRTGILGMKSSHHVILGMKSSHHVLQIRSNRNSLKMNEDDSLDDDDDDDSGDEFGGENDDDCLTEKEWEELARFRIIQVRVWQDYFGIKHHPFFCHYFKMLQVGVPIEAVKYAVEMDGYDPSIMDLEINRSLEIQLDKLSPEALENLRSMGALAESSDPNNDANGTAELTIPDTIQRVMSAFRTRRSNQIFAVSALYKENKYYRENNKAKDQNPDQNQPLFDVDGKSIDIEEQLYTKQQGDHEHKSMSDLHTNNQETRSDSDEITPINQKGHESTPKDQHKQSKGPPLHAFNSGDSLDESMDFSHSRSSRTAYKHRKKRNGTQTLQHSTCSLPLIVIGNEESQRSERRKPTSSKKKTTKISLASTITIDNEKEPSSKIIVKDETKSLIGTEKTNQQGSSQRLHTRSKTIDNSKRVEDEHPIKEIIVVDNADDSSIKFKKSIQSELESLIRRNGAFIDDFKRSKEKSTDEVLVGRADGPTSLLTDDNNSSNNTKSARNEKDVSDNCNIALRELQSEIPTTQFKTDNMTKVSVPFNDVRLEDLKKLEAELAQAKKVISAKNIKIHNLQDEFKRKVSAINSLERRIQDMNDTSNMKIHDLQQGLKAKDSVISNLEHQIQEMIDKNKVSNISTYRVNDRSNATGSEKNQDVLSVSSPSGSRRTTSSRRQHNSKARDQSIDKQGGSKINANHVVSIPTSREHHKNENIVPTQKTNNEREKEQKFAGLIDPDENVASNQKSGMRESNSNKHTNHDFPAIVAKTQILATEMLEAKDVSSSHNLYKIDKLHNEKDESSRHSKKQIPLVHERRTKSRKPKHDNARGENRSIKEIDVGGPSFQSVPDNSFQNGARRGSIQESDPLKRTNTSRRNLIDVTADKRGGIVTADSAIVMKSHRTNGSIDAGGNYGRDEGKRNKKRSPSKDSTSDNGDTATKEVILNLFANLIS